MDSFDLSFLTDSSSVPIPRKSLSNCFACSPSNDKGLKLNFSFNASLGYCYSQYVIPADFSGFEGMAHGGIISTLLDETAGWTIISTMNQFGLTKSANIKFIKPVPVEKEIVLIGEIKDKPTTNTLMLRTAIYLPNGKILAEMESNWLLPDLDQMQKISGKSRQELEELTNEFTSKN